MGCLIDHLHLYVSEIQNKCGFVYEVMFWTVYFSVSIVKKTKKMFEREWCNSSTSHDTSALTTVLFARKRSSVVEKDSCRT